MNKKTKLIFLTLLVYGVPIFLWSAVPFLRNLWGSYGDSFIFNFLFFGKEIFLPMGIISDLLLFYCIFILLFKKDFKIENDRVYSIYSGLKKFLGWVFFDKLKKALTITKEEKISVLFYLVKLFFTPIMIKFLIDSINSLTKVFQGSSLINLPEFTKLNMMGFYFPAIFYLMLVVDTLIFSFGYLFESAKLKNIVKSVEPTTLGWTVALICYPPVNSLTVNILGWYSSDFSNFSNINVNIIAAALSVLLFSIYVWASIALGFKASNLTNRGIVSSGPYKYVRHPAYSAKNLSWWIMGIPFIMRSGLIAIFSLSVWSIIYFLRALTEEKHLSQDPDYLEYMKKVKYMFIPGIF